MLVMGKHKQSRREHKSSYRSFSSSEDSRSSKNKRNKINDTDNQASKQSESDKCLSDDRVNKNEFSFEHFKHVLNKVFFRDSGFVDDIEDFWLFVKKYEGVQRKAKAPTNFDKIKLINITLNISIDIYYSKVFPDDRYSLSRHHLEDFKNIILLYTDFKQKEKYVKLKKLRQFQNDLPVAQYKDDIVEAVRRERVLIIAGDTGCGKSTQVPQYLLKAGYNRIACTQPRRIACISLSKRVSYETLSEFKSDIGYQIRFEKNRNQETKIIFITEGLLLRQLSGEDALPDYEVIVLDEVHERHLYGDFLLGVVKCLLFQLPNLKIILMSATININLFSNFFGDVAKVIQVPGRLHPIKLHYKPITIEEKAHSSKSDRLNPGPYVQIMQLIDSKYPKSERGDLLIFLSGMSEITSVIDAAQQYNEKAASWIILPLHSSLSLVEQDKVFSYPPEGMRKCIVSTNIAETSITIDGIRFVIDSGKVKEMSYDPVSKMQRLKEFTVSRASAEQRKGRAGRTGPGVCYRLYSEEDYNEMSDYTTPELQRVPLDSLLLQMIAMGLPDARKFPFIEPPPPESIETSILSLKQHSALTEDEKITVLGQMLSKLPVDIPLGKMLITATMFHQLETVVSLAATLSVQTPFTNRAYRDPECETSRKELESDHGDPITYLNAFREWLEVKSKANNARGSYSSRLWCKRRGLEEQRFYEMTKLRSQFRDLLKDCGLLELSEQAGSTSKEGMSSNERSLRHGEVKLLKAMKRTYQQSNPGRPKVLKPDSYQLVSPDNENEMGDDQIDIRDVDFRLSHDSSKVQNLVSGSTASSYRDVTMLKVILCSGLYPQVAIPDEFNHCKGVNDQLYHTRDKPFVWLHPMSFFGNNPQILQLQESDITQAPSGFSSKNPLSNKHQILFYMSLLETTKPYLVNTLRMPAAQTLLLFAREIHTNSTFSKIICDSWLELNFLSHEASESLIIKVARLRSLWNELLKLKLEEKDCTKTERILTNCLLQLMNGHIIYSMKRLLTADIKTLYYGPSLCFNDTEDDINNQVNPIVPEYRITKNSKIGGLQLAPYLVYNCLNDDDNAFESWQCPHCEMVAALSALERLQHLHICQPKEERKVDIAETIQKKPNSRPYDCPECKKQYFFTPTDILKHKKSHQQ